MLNIQSRWDEIRSWPSLKNNEFINIYKKIKIIVLTGSLLHMERSMKWHRPTELEKSLDRLRR